MVASYLIDSNILIDYTSQKFGGTAEKRLDDIFDNGFSYSIISFIEVLGYNAPADILSKIEDFLLTGNIYDITLDVRNVTIQLRR